MAFLNNPKCTATNTLMRSLRFSTIKVKNIQFSTSQIITKNNFEPVKYTTTKAAKIPISETIGLLEPRPAKLWFHNYVVLGSVASFVIYFLFLRKENDIDEILKGNSNFLSPRSEILKLKIHLKYCEANKLPTAALKAKIKELEEREGYYSPTRV